MMPAPPTPAVEAVAVKESSASFKDYVAIARPDHWTKNLFMLPGLFLGMLVSKKGLGEIWWPLMIGFAATCLISSANYTINEWLDRHFDRFHPKKRLRPSVSGRIRAVGVYSEYVALAIGGLALSALINVRVLEASAFLLVMGILYNVQPFRTKDRAYLDVVSESINNPIRLCMGWLIAVPDAFPPSSLLLGYWFGGAFLMAVKRFAEFRTIGDKAVAGQYRRSFQSYTEESLLASAVFHAMAASLFLGVFLAKHRIELLLSFPLIALLFAWYIRMGYDEDSATQHPEKLLRERKFMLYVLLLTVVMAILFVVEIPEFRMLLKDTFPELRN
ncbi:MAG TPA: UbiA prenyltransferase family protein [Verrucomicrobiae bacterium]|nr:UbiA prenyltransferase family protein [Verrucomicrobiae bacterium]